ncbi:Arylformamidase [Sulfitobacter noctilucicola]|uniref:Arylformamidase n=1 Tax=Sulfitobacter noctilucicola TaxID=1342301 RepID=A0A7W6Q2R0_9RHOB|nr:alpha/beta hydrolase [Sulfitobacter noctilucicola]KIN62152.1 Arylformamidase [Sulfitobacter noctilucicola]MBB4173330.1 arylformamidase [Sulfitobacter noctilucicola]
MDHRLSALLSLPRAEIDFQLSPSRSAKDAAGSLNTMVSQTRQALTHPKLKVDRDLEYGPRTRQKIDVFRPDNPEGAALPCLVFIHGGFWQEGDKSVAGFAAESFAEMGWAWISVGYTLTPDVTLSALTAEVHEAVEYISSNASTWGIDPRKIVLAGHSAGAHLAASVVTDALGLNVAPLIAGAVLISGVYELAPIAASYVNDLARITPEEIAALSPLRQIPAAASNVHLLIGADEPEAFQIQTQVLQITWSTLLDNLTCEKAAGRDHFDVLEELNDPASPTRVAINNMV